MLVLGYNKRNNVSLNIAKKMSVNEIRYLLLLENKLIEEILDPRNVKKNTIIHY